MLHVGIGDRRRELHLDSQDAIVTLHDEVLLSEKQEKDFAPASIGVLTQPADIVGWERRTRERFQFLAELDDNEQRWANCDPRDRDAVEAALSNRGYAPG